MVAPIPLLPGYQRAGPLALPPGSMSGLLQGVYQGIPLSVDYMRRMATPAPPPLIPMLPPQGVSQMMANAPVQPPPLPPLINPPAPTRPAPWQMTMLSKDVQGFDPAFPGGGPAIDRQPQANWQPQMQPVPGGPAGPVRKSPPLSPQDKDLLARIVAFEAGNQDDLGRQAVVHVVLNRLKSGEFGSSATDVLTAPNQFEPYETKRSEVLGLSPESDAYQKGMAAIEAALAGPDPTKGATFFLNPEIVKKRRGGSLPDWATGETVTIGDHTFYNPNGLLMAGESGSDYLGGGGAEDTLGGYESTAAGMIAPQLPGYQRDATPLPAPATRRTAPQRAPAPAAPSPSPETGIDSRIDQLLKQQQVYAISQALSNAGVALASGAPWGAALASLGQAQQPGMDLGMLFQLEQLKQEEADKAQQQAQLDELIPTLPPDLQSLARIDPSAVIGGMVGERFREPAKRDTQVVGNLLIDGQTGETIATLPPGTEKLDTQVVGDKIINKQNGEVIATIPGEAAGGPFEGTGIDAQSLNIVAAYEGKKARGEPTSQDEDYAYRLARRQLEAPRQVGTPETGFTALTPPPLPSYGARPESDTSGAVGPAGGAVQITPPNEKMTFDQAADVAGIKQAITDVEAATKTILPDGFDGPIDDGVLISAYADVPRTEGRQVKQQVRRAIEVLLRARTGAAAPESEVNNYMAFYFPSPLDSPEGAKEKLRRLDEFFKNTMEEFSKGRPSQQQAVTPAGPGAAFEAENAGGVTIYSDDGVSWFDAQGNKVQ